GPVAPRERTHHERRYARSDERGMVGPTATGRTGIIGLDVAGNIPWGGSHPPAHEIIRMQETGAVEVGYPSSAVILVKYGLCLLHDFRMVQHKRPGAVQSLLFAAPMANENGPF